MHAFWEKKYHKFAAKLGNYSKELSLSLRKKTPNISPVHIKGLEILLHLFTHY